MVASAALAPYSYPGSVERRCSSLIGWSASVSNRLGLEPAGVSGRVEGQSGRGREPVAAGAKRRTIAKDGQPSPKDRKGGGKPARRRSCFFCREGIAEIDYKNVAQLR